MRVRCLVLGLALLSGFPVFAEDITFGTVTVRITNGELPQKDFDAVLGYLQRIYSESNFETALIEASRLVSYYHGPDQDKAYFLMARSEYFLKRYKSSLATFNFIRTRFPTGTVMKQKDYANAVLRIASDLCGKNVWGSIEFYRIYRQVSERSAAYEMRLKDRLSRFAWTLEGELRLEFRVETTTIDSKADKTGFLYPTNAAKDSKWTKLERKPYFKAEEIANLAKIVGKVGTYSDPEELVPFVRQQLSLMPVASLQLDALYDSNPFDRDAELIWPEAGPREKIKGLILRAFTMALQAGADTFTGELKDLGATEGSMGSGKTLKGGWYTSGYVSRTVRFPYNSICLDLLGVADLDLWITLFDPKTPEF